MFSPFLMTVSEEYQYYTIGEWLGSYYKKFSRKKKYLKGYVMIYDIGGSMLQHLLEKNRDKLTDEHSSVRLYKTLLSLYQEHYKAARLKFDKEQPGCQDDLFHCHLLGKALFKLGRKLYPEELAKVSPFKKPYFFVKK